MGNLSENRKLYDFLEHHFKELKDITEKTSHHLTLKKITSREVGLYRFVRFVFDTQDAMGLNMVTIATDAASRYIEEQTGAACIALSEFLRRQKSRGKTSSTAGVKCGQR